MRGTPFEPDEVVLLVDARGRRTLKTLTPHHRITIRGTVLRCDDIIGATEGTRLGDGEPESFLVFRPSHAQLVAEVERPAEPIFPKDVGAILVHADIRAGDHVVEVGTGAGLMTLALLRAVGSQGHVTSYEIRPDFTEVARRNVERFEGTRSNWRIVTGDARDGICDRDARVVLLDVPDPLPMLNAAALALAPGGSLVVYVPTTIQLGDVRQCLATDSRFTLVESLEVLERGWHSDVNSLRPDHRMIAHTAFLTFARRTADTAQP